MQRKITRRKILLAAPALIISRRASAFFPHGKPSATQQITWSLTYDASWATVANGGNFGGDTTGYSGGSLVNFTPQQQLDAVNAVLTNVLDFLKSCFNASCTLVLGVGWGTANGFPISGTALATHYAYPVDLPSYANMVSYLSTMATNFPDPIKASAYPTIPGSDPNPGGGTWSVQNLHYNLVRNSSGAFSTTAVGWSKTAAGANWDYTPDGSSCHSGCYGLYRAMLKEINACIGSAESGSGANSGALDLFGFDSTGNLSFVQNDSGRYFSYDNGAHHIDAANTTLCNYGTGGSDNFGAYNDFKKVGGYTGPFVDPVNPAYLGLMTQTDYRYFMLMYPVTPLVIANAGF